MKRYLLDTHVFVWLNFEPDLLPEALVDDLADLQNEVYVSAASFWEIAVNRSKGRLMFHGEISDAMRAMNFVELPICGHHCEMSAALPDVHKDPFDRLLVAQALVESLLLVTHDRLLHEYNVPIIRV